MANKNEAGQAFGFVPQSFDFVYQTNGFVPQAFDFVPQSFDFVRQTFGFDLKTRVSAFFRQKPVKSVISSCRQPSPN